MSVKHTLGGWVCKCCGISLGKGPTPNHHVCAFDDTNQSCLKDAELSALRKEVYAKALEHDAHCPKNPHVLRAEKAEADNARLKGEVESAQKEIMAAAVELGEVRPELARLKGELEKARGALEEADRRFANSGHLPMAEWLALKPAAEGEKP